VVSSGPQCRSSKSRMRITLGTFAIAFCIVVCLVSWRVVTLSIDTQKRNRLWDEFGAVTAVVAEYGIFERMPPSTLDEFLSESKERGMRYLRSGRDPWGNEFIYMVRITCVTEVATYFEVIIRSKGRNGIDEGGKGDDVECTKPGAVIDRRGPVPFA
jgi:hypothetical protein